MHKIFLSFNTLSFVVLCSIASIYATEVEKQQSKPEAHELITAIARQELEAFPLQEQKTQADVACNGVIDPDDDAHEQANEEAFDPNKFYEFFTQEIIAPQEHHKKARAYTILAAAEAKASAAWMNNSIIDASMWTDLNLLYGNKEHPTTFLGELLQAKHTHTEMGKAYFNGLIARPTADVALLKSRQHVIKEFVENEVLFESLDTHLKNFGQHEALLTGLWGKEQLMQFVQQDCYFAPATHIKNWPRLSKFLSAVNKQLNRSSLALDVKVGLDKTSAAYGLALSHITPALLAAYGVISLTQVIALPEKVAAYTDTWMASRLFSPSLSALLAFAYVTHNQASQGSAALAATYAELSNLPRSWKHFSVGLRYDDFLRKRLIHVAQSIKIMNEVRNLVPQHVQQDLTFFKYLNELNGANTDLAELVATFNTATFAQDALDSESLLFRRGRVLYAYRLFNRVKYLLEPAIAAIGELDSFLTAANLIKESAGTRTPYCFPAYIKNAPRPSIELQDFWNPFIDPTIVVANSIKLGHAWRVPHIVATGPNSGGKSTIFVKGIALPVILAQSLGIAPARTMAVTPFHHAALYANVTDSIVDKESRFQREGKQAFAHGDHIKALSERGQFSLAIFDEIFSGTSPEEGALWGYLTAKGFAMYPNCICIVATHFTKLTELETDTQGLFVNYKVSIEEDERGNLMRDETGKLKRTYTIARGISTQHIAREVLQEQGVQSPFFMQNFVMPAPTDKK